MKTIDDIIRLTNGFGPYQYLTISITLISAGLVGYLEQLPAWVLRTPDHRCYIPQLDTQYNNSEVLQLAIPYEIKNTCQPPPLDYEIQYEQCLEKNITWSEYSSLSFEELLEEVSSLSGYDNITCQSEKYVYDFESAKSTQNSKEASITTEYNLVCEKSNLANIFIIAYSVGSAISGVTISNLADIYGRSFMLNITILIQGLICLGLCLIKQVYILIVLYGFLGFFAIFNYQTGLIYVIEIVDFKHKSWSGSFYQGFYALGIILRSF